MSKRLIYIAVAVISLLLLGSCQYESRRLARELQGSWSGAPQKLPDGPAAETTVIETFDFMGNDSVRGGNIIVNAMISMTGAIEGAPSEMVQPVSLTASASATISGVWRVIDEDEVSLALDQRTLDVAVDPKDVVLSTNLLTSADLPAVDSLSPALATQIQARIARTLKMRYLAMKYIDDVKVKDNILRFEMGGVDYTFQRQGIPLK